MFVKFLNKKLLFNLLEKIENNIFEYFYNSNSSNSHGICLSEVVVFYLNCFLFSYSVCQEKYFVILIMIVFDLLFLVRWKMMSCSINFFSITKYKFFKRGDMLTTACDDFPAHWRVYNTTKYIEINNDINVLLLEKVPIKYSYKGDHVTTNVKVLYDNKILLIRNDCLKFI